MCEYRTILVTGGSGMVGRYLQELSHQYPEYRWIFTSSKEFDLTNYSDVQKCFQLYHPFYVIHLAANVGGLYKHLNEKVEMFRSNILMNQYVVDACHQYNVQKGVFCLSTCIFPENPPSFPMTESMIMCGPPHPSNDNYAYAKRMLYQQCMNYNQQFKRNYICLAPVNLFGKYDNFNLRDSHVIPGIIHKMCLSKLSHEPLILPGSGKAVRQFLYAGDFARLIIRVLFEYQDYRMMICSSNMEVSISELVDKICAALEFNERIIYDSSKSDGILKKTASESYLRTIFPDFTYSNFDEKINEVVKWFNERYTNNCNELRL